jgi:hypothetical protein
MVVHTYNPSTWETEERGCEFEASMGYIMRPCLRKKRSQVWWLMLGIPATWEAEIGRNVV